MNVGDKVILPDGEWPIVGSFATGDLLDGQLIGDTETVMKAIRRPSLQQRAGAAGLTGVL